MPNNKQKKNRELTYSLLPTFLPFTPRYTKISFRDARQKQSTSYDPSHGEKPIRDDHSLMPYARGNPACSRGDDCVAEMFFSLFFIYLLLLFHESGCKSTHYFRITQVLWAFFWFFAHLFVPLRRARRYFCSKKKRKTCFLFAFCSLIRTFAAKF